jgi:hypothetical protein
MISRKSIVFINQFLRRKFAMRFTHALILASAAVLAACSADTTTPDTVATGAEADVVIVEPRLAAATGGDASVSVIHGINGTDLGLSEALPVDVSVNGGCALTGFTFRSIVGPIALPEGSYNIVVSLPGATPCGGTPVITANGVALSGGTSYSIIAHLSAAGAPTASVFTNAVDAFPPSRVNVSARHTAAFGAVDIAVTGPAGRTSLPFTGVVNGQQGTAGLLPNKYTIGIQPAGSGINAATLAVQPRPQTFYAVYAVGTPSKGTFELLTQTLPAPVQR